MIDALPSWIVAMSRAPEDAAEPPARARSADAEHVERLYLQLEGALTNTLYRWLWNREEVRDVVQEAFVRLWQMRERVDWPRAEPLVYRIAINLAANRRRRRKLWRWVALEAAPEPEAVPPGGDPEQERAVQRAIDALPERLRRVLVLSLHAELSYEQIAAILEIPPGTVASRRNTAVARLREALARWQGAR